MRELEAYNRKERHPFKEGVQLVNHISYCMDDVNEAMWYEFIYKEIPKTTGQFRKPHLTVAYSYQPIEGFPEIDLESDEFTVLKNEDILTIYRNKVRYGIFKDPFSTLHLVMYVDSDALIQKHQEYLEKGANWPLGLYDPFILIESHTSHNASTISQLPLPNRDYLFSVLRYCRFGEYTIEKYQQLKENENEHT